nr:abc transporter g family member 31 [Quercus suber]POF23720.1 abc transporter g family member 31 [Quercus suber]
MQVILIGVISANNVIPQNGRDRLLYFREKRAGMYLPVFYPISWAVGEIPYFLMATLAVVGIGNGMASIGTQSPSEFIKYWTVLFLFTLCLTYFGMLITFLAPVPTLAAFAVSIVTSLWVSASEGCGSQCNCPRLQDGSYVWDRLETLRSLSHERIDLDILILSAMCLLFANLASVFFVLLRHNSPPPI